MIKSATKTLLAGAAIVALSVSAYADTPVRGFGASERGSPNLSARTTRDPGLQRRNGRETIFGRESGRDSAPQREAFHRDDRGWGFDGPVWGSSRRDGRRYGRDERYWNDRRDRTRTFWNWGGGASEREINELVDRYDRKRAKHHQETDLTAAALAAPMTSLRAGDLEFESADAGPLAQALYTTLKTGGGQALRVREEFAGPIISFYKERGFQPVWIGAEGLNQRAERLLSLLSKANEEGLRRDDYLPASLDDFAADGGSFKGDDAALARLELELTRSALDYALHLSTGRVAPSKVSRNIDVQPDAPAPGDVLARLGQTVRPDEELRAFTPRSGGYDGLKALLAEYRQIERNGGWTEVPQIGKLSAGERHPSVPALRARLIESGDYTAPAFDTPETIGEGKLIKVSSDGASGDGGGVNPIASRVYDDALVAAVESFQASRGLSIDGVVGPNTVRELNEPVGRQIGQIALNMERRRWLPDDLGETYVFVNKTEFMTRVIDKGEVIYESKVIIGKEDYQTAEFYEEIETVVFHPYWNVPRSIATEEMLPKLLRNASYLSNSGFEVRNGRGQFVHSGNVDWREAALNGFPYDIRQTPGRSNALGLVKFLFPNKHAIYMHDTPTKPLFNQSTRMFSHGCVRVEKPYEFAALLLKRQGWSQADVDAALANKSNRQVSLDKKVPVYLAYHTMWVDRDGKAQFRQDFYGRDERLNTALGQIKVAIK